ncbi:outer membrane beta-barrel protein [Vibrio ostreicida]|uniref:Outer membrane beta-barrel protein n=1 Tax=Vibrio ostreicida TaxID=526588 RepID=A0ABT8BSZ7_9VIBR|nr:outer membrane beta-barrel protein [Vibrio ostreicida]MDN3609335.1 outer membrane beta-barrel protein [Vibrio ostreicida]NPD08227.1 porin family protein [Vibrio ostreicida]
MNKAILLAASTALISLPSLAGQNYVALEIGNGSYDVSATDGARTVVNDMRNTGFISLKGGHYFSDNLRAYGYVQTGGETSVEYIRDNIKFAISSYELGIGADYLFNVSNNFYLLAGTNIGLHNSKFEISGTKTGRHINDSNSVLASGVILGAGYHFTKQFSMELGYRYSYFHDNEFKFEGTEAKFKASNTAYLNASYAF